MIEMLDDRGGWKAADTTLWREHLHAATMLGRVAAARRAVELGYAIETDPGPSGRLRHWRVAGVPQEVCEVHSKRAGEIDAECARRGTNSYRARGMAARSTRSAKGHQCEGEAAGPVAVRADVGGLARRASGRLHRRGGGRRAPGRAALGVGGSAPAGGGSDRRRG